MVNEGPPMTAVIELTPNELVVLRHALSTAMTKIESKLVWLDGDDSKYFNMVGEYRTIMGIYNQVHSTLNEVLSYEG